MRVVSIILARGGSKGIPKKNIIDFCGKPLIGWTLEQSTAVDAIDSVWVSSDSDEILAVGAEYGARSIKRPAPIAGDTATSESAWIHAIAEIEKEIGKVDLVIAPQVTSPLRHSRDFENGLKVFQEGGFDSLFSCGLAEDLYFWEKKEDGEIDSVNYDWRNRKRRQDHEPQFIENGSFYIFTPEVIREHNNRFGGKIGMVEMEFWKTFEIDDQQTLKLCEAIMNSFMLNK